MGLLSIPLIVWLRFCVQARKRRKCLSIANLKAHDARSKIVGVSKESHENVRSQKNEIHYNCREICEHSRALSFSQKGLGDVADPFFFRRTNVVGHLTRIILFSFLFSSACYPSRRNTGCPHPRHYTILTSSVTVTDPFYWRPYGICPRPMKELLRLPQVCHVCLGYVSPSS